MQRRNRTSRLHSHRLGDAPEGLTYEYSIKLLNRNVDEGTALRVRNRRGDFKFLRRVTRTDSVWLDLQSPLGSFISVREADISRIPRAKAKK